MINFIYGILVSGLIFFVVSANLKKRLFDDLAEMLIDCCQTMVRQGVSSYTVIAALKMSIHRMDIKLKSNGKLTQQLHPALQNIWTNLKTIEHEKNF